jgi:hypothetical protein
MWGMIPLTVFGSVPRIGCICSNGQHKFFCERIRHGDAEGPCTCCHPKVTAKPGSPRETQTRPAGARNCCPRNRGSEPAEFPVVRSESPCRPVVDKAVFLSVVKSALDFDRADGTPLFAAIEPLPEFGRCAAADLHNREFLPAPDLVVTLGVLLI